MFKKFSKIFLIIGIFSFFILSASFCLAIDAPDTLKPCNGKEQPFAGLFLNWNQVDGADHYELYYRKIDDKDWTDKYPLFSEYEVGSLKPETEYKWFVITCGDPECNNKSEVGDICSFATKELGGPINNGNNGNGNGNHNGGELLNPLKAKTLGEAINALINFLFYLMIIVAPIMIIYGAFLMLFSEGDAKKTGKARQIIFWTLVALAIVVLAKGLPSIIIGAFGG